MQTRESAVNQNHQNQFTAMPIVSPNNQAYLDEVKKIDRNISKMRARRMKTYQEAEGIFFTPNIREAPCYPNQQGL